MASKRLQFSRWKRLPGVKRVGEQRLLDPGDEAQRLSLYLPGKLLDEAGELARAAGVASIQKYCEGLLAQAISAERARHRLANDEEMRGVLDRIDALASELHGAGSAEEVEEGVEAAAEGWYRLDGLNVESDMEEGLSEAGEGTAGGELAEVEADPRVEELLEKVPLAVEAVMRHAGMSGGGEEGFLARLRRGEAVGHEDVSELLTAIQVLELGWMEEERIDRRAAFALHRVAFEGQLLVSEGWPTLGADEATVSALRAVQEAVDRVLSGEDIRYEGGGTVEEQ